MEAPLSGFAYTRLHSETLDGAWQNFPIRLSARIFRESGAFLLLSDSKSQSIDE